MNGFISLISLLVCVSGFQQHHPIKRISSRSPIASFRAPIESPTALFAGRAAVAAKPGSLVLAGQLASTFSKLVITPHKAEAIVAAVTKAFFLGELFLIIALGWGSLPVARFIHGIMNRDETEEHFLKSKTFKAIDLVSQISKIGTIVYAADLLSVVLRSVGITFPFRTNLSGTVAKIAYVVWLALKLTKFKQRLIMRAVRAPTPEKLGKNQVYDRLFDMFIAGSTTLWILDLLSVETGRAMGSIFALGSVGTLVFSLASKDIATLFVSGLALSASGRFYEGEEIEIGDGTRGIVNKVGWMYTEIRGFDEVIIKIPNSQIANQRVKNISRIRKCQVKTDLWIKHEDIKKIPQLIVDIKQEVVDSCPKLITDSRAFRVNWREIEKDHLTLNVDAHFNVPASGTPYWDNRQEVMMAIARAAERSGVEFAIPRVEVKNGQSIEQVVNQGLFESESFNDAKVGDGVSNTNGSSP